MKLIKQFSFVVSPQPPFNFTLTVKKPARWFWLNLEEVLENNVLWTATRIEDVPIGVKLKNLGTIEEPKVSVKVFGRKSVKEVKEEVKELVRYALGCDEDLRSFYKICDAFDILRRAREHLYGMKTHFTPVTFHRALLAITLQMASIKRSREMLRSIVENYGDVLLFDGKRLLTWPSAKRLAKISERELKIKCKLGYRASYIREISKLEANRKLPSFLELLSLTPKLAKKRLMEIHGIGEYSAEIVSPHNEVPIDIWSAKLFCKVFEIRTKKQGREMIPLVKKWVKSRFGEHARKVFVYVIQELELSQA